MLGAKVDPGTQRVEVDGVPISPSPLIYILLNKPKGYITSVKDERGRPTVMELLKGVKERVYPVGRLDMDSEGLLLLSNDGELAYRLLHPRYHVERRYRVRVRCSPRKTDLKRLQYGMHLEGGKTGPMQIQVIKQGKETEVEVVLREGKKRQIRRMFEAIGCPVVSLVRVALGELTLKGVPQGRFRYLTREEVERLKRAAGLASNPKTS